MIKKYLNPFCLVLLLFLTAACKSKIKQQDDEVYSRHLQRQVKLTIISTPMPGDKTEMNLLLMNDGQEFGQLRIKEIVDSLYSKKLIKPLLVVGIHAGDRMKEYGVADYPDFLKRGDKAGYYDDFVNNELYPYAKKNATFLHSRAAWQTAAMHGGYRNRCNSVFQLPWRDR